MGELPSHKGQCPGLDLHLQLVAVGYPAAAVALKSALCEHQELLE